MQWVFKKRQLKPLQPVWSEFVCSFSNIKNSILVTKSVVQTIFTEEEL